MQRVLLTVRSYLVTMVGLFLMMCISLGTPGCGHDGGGSTVFKEEGTYKTGYFIDSPVEGLQYRSITWLADGTEGLTGPDGSFFYSEGEEITFFIGGVVLGRAIAKEIITPSDLDNNVEENFSTEAVNVTRFLLSLDEDLNPENGIKIPASLTDALKDIQVDFSNPDLDNDAGVQEMFEILNGSGIYPEEDTRSLVSYESAETHLEYSLNAIAEAEAEEEEALSNLELHAAIVPPCTSIIMLENQSLNLQSSISGGKTPYKYSWQINGQTPLSAKQNPGTYVFKNKGSYILTFSVTDNAGTTKTDTRHVSVFGTETQEGQTSDDPIPSVAIHREFEGAVFRASSTVDFQAQISNGNLPLYYTWFTQAGSANIVNPRDETVIYLSPLTFMSTQSITLNATGTYDVGLSIKDTSVGGKTQDTHASGVLITVE